MNQLDYDQELIWIEERLNILRQKRELHDITFKTTLLNYGLQDSIIADEIRTLEIRHRKIKESMIGNGGKKENGHKEVFGKPVFVGSGS